MLVTIVCLFAISGVVVYSLFVGVEQVLDDVALRAFFDDFAAHVLRVDPAVHPEVWYDVTRSQILQHQVCNCNIIYT